jgi:putative nucleotidyltransferase with HDIG domain
MLVHIIADKPGKFPGLRSMLEPYCSVDCALLDGDDDAVRGEYDATIVAADLRTVENISALKQIAAGLRCARKRIFLIDQRGRLFNVQAYALGATHVLVNPVDKQTLLAALVDSGPTGFPAKQTARGARDAASGGATAIASMFSAVLGNEKIDIALAKRAASNIADSIVEDGLSTWLQTVRHHHEGTYQHCLLVTGVAVDFGLHLGLASADLERLHSAAMFHDIGKAKIPLAVLDKAGRLDPQERALIETHPAAGYDVLKGTPGLTAEILDAVRHHHEYLDGSGYPDALCADGICDLVRILTISDIFAALIEDRRYKPPMPREQAYEIMRGMRGKLEGPLIAAFKEVALNR